MARFKKGDYKVVCDLTGAVVNASDCRLMWNGLFVLKSLWMPRHPQDHIAPPSKEIVPLHPRPEGTAQFISATDVTADDL